MREHLTGLEVFDRNFTATRLCANSNFHCRNSFMILYIITTIKAHRMNSTAPFTDGFRILSIKNSRSEFIS